MVGNNVAGSLQRVDGHWGNTLPALYKRTFLVFCVVGVILKHIDIQVNNFFGSQPLSTVISRKHLLRF
jgi:hypothetical protein